MPDLECWSLPKMAEAIFTCELEHTCLALVYHPHARKQRCSAAGGKAGNREASSFSEPTHPLLGSHEQHIWHLGCKATLSCISRGWWLGWVGLGSLQGLEEWPQGSEGSAGLLFSLSRLAGRA